MTGLILKTDYLLVKLIDRSINRLNFYNWLKTGLLIRQDSLTDLLTG